MKRTYPSLPLVSVALSLAGGPAVSVRAEQPPWSREMTVRAEDGAEEDRFGEVLALSDETLAVGVPEEGVGRSGAVYLFERRQVPGAWVQIAKIVPSGLETYDSFGQAIALDGDLLAVGVNSNDDQGGAAGAVCFFARDAGGPDAWGQVGKVTTPDPGADDRFAQAVAMRGETLVVGAFRADSFGIPDAGAAYIYERRPGAPGEWELVAELWPSDPVVIGFFGSAVAVHGPRLVIGAPHEDAGFYDSAGAAYVYERGIDGWHQVARLESADPYYGFTFGDAVAIEDDTILVMDPDQAHSRRLGVHVFERTAGEPPEWLQVTKLEGGGLGRSSFALSRGEIVTAGNEAEVLLYARDTSGAWRPRGRLLAPDRLSEAFFGSAVAFDRGSLAAGAPMADTLVEHAGKVVMYRRFGLELAAVGTCPGPLSFEISAATPGAPVALAQGERHGRGVLANSKCPRTVLYLDEPRAVAQETADADGRLSLAIEAGLDECAIYQAMDLSACRPSRTAVTGASTHVLLAKLAPPDSAAYFGHAVAVDGERLVVGEIGDSEAAPGAGAAYVFDLDDTGRWRVQKLVAPDAGAEWTLGLEVAIDGDIVAATAIGADPIGYEGTGTVYVFERDESGEWEPAKKLKKPDGTGRIWGNSVAVDGERIAVGGGSTIRPAAPCTCSSGTPAALATGALWRS